MQELINKIENVNKTNEKELNLCNIHLFLILFLVQYMSDYFIQWAIYIFLDSLGQFQFYEMWSNNHHIS